jgi:hypothetical protein
VSFYHARSYEPHELSFRESYSPEGPEEALTTTGFAPLVDIYEDEHNITLKIEVRCIDENDIDVRIENKTSPTTGVSPISCRLWGKSIGGCRRPSHASQNEYLQGVIVCVGLTMDLRLPCALTPSKPASNSSPVRPSGRSQEEQPHNFSRIARSDFCQGA